MIACLKARTPHQRIQFAGYVVGLTVVLGCGGESTEDRFLRMARTRALINQEEAAAKESATDVKEAEPAPSNSVAPETNSSQTVPPAEVASLDSDQTNLDTDSLNADSENSDSPKPDTDIPQSASPEIADHSAPEPRMTSIAGDALDATDATRSQPQSRPLEKSQQPEESHPNEESHHRWPRALWAVDSTGSQIVYSDASQAIGIFDIPRKKLTQQIFNPHIQASSLGL
ncbi:MAG: hypothetical protein AAF745_03565, partial [Planctomycetota bacterium]